VLNVAFQQRLQVTRGFSENAFQVRQIASRQNGGLRTPRHQPLAGLVVEGKGYGAVALQGSC
jgi:hypothetical protein